jgi:heat shock protein HslJ
MRVELRVCCALPVTASAPSAILRFMPSRLLSWAQHSTDRPAPSKPGFDLIDKQYLLFALTATREGCMKKAFVLAFAALLMLGCWTPAGADGIAEKYWKLVELGGKPVPPMEREPYMILRSDKRVNGFGGCNVFTGDYRLDASASRLSFGQIASTMMACVAGMEMEQAFHEALRHTDSYTLDGDRLALIRARMAPLARFEAVYLR